MVLKPTPIFSNLNLLLLVNNHGTAMLVALAANALAFSMRKWMVPCVSFIMVF